MTTTATTTFTMSTSPSKAQETPLTIPALLNALHTHLQTQTQLLPTLHAQLGLPPSAIADELQALQHHLTETVESQVQKRRNEVDEWMKKCDELERECSRYSKALGGHIKSIGATIGELRKQQVLPVRFEMVNQFRDKVDQLYKAKLEQQTNYINRIVTLSRTLGTHLFSPDMMELCAAQGEDPSDILSLRDVTPERFSKLDKEFYRGKAEINNRFHLLAEAFKRLDELYAILGMEPPSTDSLASSSLLLCPPNPLSLSVNSVDPFMSSISSISTPTPQSRQSKTPTASLFSSSDNAFAYQQIFCKYVYELDQRDPEGKMDDSEREKLLEGVEPSQGLLEWANLSIKELEAIESQRQAQIESMCDQLINLWKRLDISVDEMEQFMEQHKGVTDECVAAYEKELEGMMRIKRERMEEFVENARSEIKVLWDELMMSPEERNEFMPFSERDFTEELLAVHEEEIRRLKDEVELKALLLAKITKYYEICADQKELQKSAADQGRLMGRGTRGDPGRLLREEKMRKRVQKDLPKLVDELLRKLPTWEAEQDRPFIVNGVRFLDVLLESVEGKENSKKPRAGSVPPRSRTPGPPSASSSNRPPSTGSDALSHSVPNKRQRLASSSRSISNNLDAQEPLPHRVPFSSRAGAANVASSTDTIPQSTSKHGRTPSSSLPRPKSVTRTHPPTVSIPPKAAYGNAIGLGYPSSGMRSHPIEATRSISHSAVENKPALSSVRSARASRRESFKPRASVDSMAFLNHKDAALNRFMGSSYGSSVKEEDEE
ncbi:hypothetical protein SCHPADRAFT_845934 [Schizopora paradoxa]|uniref:Microtubule associated protein n=1 Tax=Schizopora paradoxa TaxID=27342 RepID=A0A0H2S1Q3_9AGAM|nr:hypothetical protein SCHPADRAFT_845934 [Schizopora paradoxa]